MRSSVKELARALYSTGDAVNLYELHVDYQLTPAEAIRASEFFVRLGIVDRDGMFVRPRPGARDWIASHRQKFFLDAKRPWAEVDLNGIDPRKPYMPALGKIELKFFLGLLDQSSRRP